MRKRIVSMMLMICVVFSVFGCIEIDVSAAYDINGGTLNSARWILDPGHGGSDPGAGLGSRSEANDVLKLSKAVAKILIDNGETVAFTRTTDTYVELSQRANIQKAGNFQFFLSIHRNAFNNVAYGVETYYYNGLSASSEGAVFAGNIQKKLAETNVFYNRGVKSANFAVLRETSCSAALVEVGFIDNPDENTKFDNNFNTIARAIAAGCLAQVGKTINDGVTKTPILKAPSATVNQGENWARSKGATDTFISLAQIFWELAPKSGVDPAMAYAQSAKETGYGKFGGVLDESFKNPCGLKTQAGGGDGEPSAHTRFPSWRVGIQAHVDHLALYAGAAGYPKADSPDPRHFPFIYGTAPYVEDLGGKWAPSLSYGTDILNMVAAMKQASNAEGPAIPLTNQFIVDKTNAGLWSAIDNNGQYMKAISKNGQLSFERIAIGGGDQIPVQYNNASRQKPILIDLDTVSHLYADFEADNGWDITLQLRMPNDSLPDYDATREVTVSLNKYLNSLKGNGYTYGLYGDNDPSKIFSSNVAVGLRSMIAEALKADTATNFAIPSDGRVQIVEIRVTPNYVSTGEGVRLNNLALKGFSPSDNVMTSIFVESGAATVVEGMNIDRSKIKLKAKYLDMTTTDVTEYTITAFDNSKVGTQTVQLIYNGKSTPLTVQVLEKSIIGIRMANAPNKSIYALGEAFESGGMMVVADYNNGTQGYTWNYRVSGFDSSVPGQNTVTITAGQVKTTFQVTIVRYGDVNNDGTIDNKDVALLKRYVAKLSGISLDAKAADVNRDGSIDNKDVAILKRYIAKWSGVTLPSGGNSGSSDNEVEFPSEW